KPSMRSSSSNRLAALLLEVALMTGWLVAPSLQPVARADTAQTARITISFDHGWRFLKADDITGAERPSFDDASWRRLDVPHDWSIEGPFSQKNPTGGAGGFLPAGIGWYRKHFALPLADSSRQVFIEFDGVMANSDVWINGHHLGHRPYGYVSFSYELTSYLNYGEGATNVLAVRADNSNQPASRWYTGAGIYRHVRLVVTDHVHLEHWGTFITTPKVATSEATVRVQSRVVNQSEKPRDVSLQITLLDTEGRPVQTVETKPQEVAAGQGADFQQEIPVKSPQLWNLDRPSLYRAVTRVRAGGQTLDEETTSFGIREFHFDADTGFWLNGKNFKIKGVCLHHDASAFGAAVPLRAWERRLEALRALGVNAIRTAHNPPAPEFLDLCDRMGFLVMDELFDCWTVAKNPYDYHLFFREWSKTDLRDTVRRDRNHPSIIAYSAGNEIHDTPKADLAKEILSTLVAAFHEADPTRPVTQALFRPNVSHDYDNGLADLLDVVGQNYRENEILAAHRQKPSRKILGTENRHDREAWLALRDNPPYAGQFLWAGIDYLGESRQWPNVADNFGLLDRTGEPKPLAFQRQSWWGTLPMVHITRRVAPTPLGPTDPGYGTAAEERRPQVLLSDWTPRNASAHEETVEVYSNCERVELFLNGKSLGTKERPADDSPRVWKVAFAPGVLRAVGSNGGKAAATHELRTAGRPARILLNADRQTLAPAWDDVVYVTATVVDAHGIIVPDANDLITFKVRGPGAVAAVDSADNNSHEPFQATERRAYQGRCFAMLRASASGGRITLTASSPGLAAGTVNVRTVVQSSSVHTR
ncbi:MAG TPA: glycoside hydrolase family 2 TIM barrel-domain containing protein, partial [Pyrinomonadaceae bacterium]|nr:glycoside hydrolase family 2 TIM barrel-domain containing protein [Pyrinomonadaceae bacterium]